MLPIKVQGATRSDSKICMCACIAHTYNLKNLPTAWYLGCSNPVCLGPQMWPFFQCQSAVGSRQNHMTNNCKYPEIIWEGWNLSYRASWERMGTSSVLEGFYVVVNHCSRWATILHLTSAIGCLPLDLYFICKKLQPVWWGCPLDNFCFYNLNWKSPIILIGKRMGWQSSWHI